MLSTIAISEMYTDDILFCPYTCNLGQIMVWNGAYKHK